MSRVRAVYFDAVGTVLFPQPSPAEVYTTLARRYGVELDPRVIRQRIIDGYRLHEEADATTNGSASEQGERTRWFGIVRHALPEVQEIEACFHDLWEHYRSPLAWRVHPEVSSLFVELSQRGLVLGMGSNFDARLAALVEVMTELHPIRERCLISSLVGWRKPSPPFFAAVIASAGCDPHEILFVGDDIRNDYHGARNCGLRVALLDPDGRHPDVPERISAFSELLDSRFGC